MPDLLPPVTPSPPTAQLPTLTSQRAARYEEKVGALRLIADSVAQQRQLASRTLIMHPLNISLTLLLLAALAQYLSPAIFFTTSAGVIMAMLVAVRGATGGYLVTAEKIGWKWLDVSAEDEAENKALKGDETVILITKWGEEIIAVVVVKLLKKEKRGLVRAWTTGLRYRGKGVGKDLLEQGVDVALRKGFREIVFDEKHASEFLIHLDCEICLTHGLVQIQLASSPRSSIGRLIDGSRERGRRWLQ